MVGSPITSSKRTKPTDPLHWTYCFNETIQFFDHFITGDEKWVPYDSPKIKRQWLSTNEFSRWSIKCLKKSRFCVVGGIFALMLTLKCWKLYILLMRTLSWTVDRVNQSLIRRLSSERTSFCNKTTQDRAV